ncbi:MAG TPA: hypothetical protein VGB53_11120 [Rubricoccaceae bacterium]
MRCLLVLFATLAFSVAPTAVAQSTEAARDGQQDFDFEIGRWHTRLSRLDAPLTGSTTWHEYEGTTVVREVWGGRSNLVEFEVDGAAGHIELLSLRLYNPATRQWSLHAGSARSGTLFPPVVGEFRDGRGAFYGVDTVDGRAILARFVVSQVTPDTWRFEQAFSADGGATWEVNWVVDDTKVSDESDEAR